MAYEIISQNNNTTTLSDGTNTITVPSRVVLATGTTYEITEVNNSTATLEGSDGSVIRDVPCVAVLAGGGGGSSLPDQTGHSGEFLTTDGTDASWSNKALVNVATGASSVITGGATTNSATYVVAMGYGATSNGSSVCVGDHAKTSTRSVALGADAEATASGTLNDYSVAIGLAAKASASRSVQIGTGTNSDANTFKVGNTNGNYEIMSGDGTIPTDRYTTTPSADGTYVPTLTISSGTPTRSWAAPSGGLPSQTGNSGKFLTTDGTNASWSNKPLVNTATGMESLAILGVVSNKQRATAVGNSTTATEDSVAIGRSATTYATYNTAVGSGAKAASTSTYNSRGDTAIGGAAEATKGYGLALGYAAKVNAFGAVQIGPSTNATAATVCIALKPDANTAATNYRVLDSDGTIPTARLTKANTTVTLAVADWSSSTQTVSVTGVTATSIVLVAPDPSDTADYVAAGILCTSQTTNSLTFTATTTPTNDIDVNIVCL